MEVNYCAAGSFDSSSIHSNEIKVNFVIHFFAFCRKIINAECCENATLGRYVLKKYYGQLTVIRFKKYFLNET